MPLMPPTPRRRAAAAFATIAASAATLLAPIAASAANFGLEDAVSSIGSNKPSSFTNVTNDPAVFIGKIISAVLGVVGVVFLVMMIYGGFLWMSARGESKTVEKAKELIKSAIIGIVIVAGAYVITTFVVTAIAGK